MPAPGPAQQRQGPGAGAEPDGMIEVEAAALSDPGPRRSTNEDCLGAHVPTDPLVRQRKGLLFALADGVGGQRGGDVASATAVAALIEEYYSPSNHTRIEPALRHAVQTANLRVYTLGQQRAELRAMATTLSAVALAGAHAYVAHVGDSRVYLWRDGALTQLTSDHSEAAELVRMRLVKPERLRDHPRRSVLTRALGEQLIVRPDFLRQPLQPGDQLLLCTDGLWAELNDAELTQALGRCAPAEACRALVEAAIRRDCSDNLSVQIIRVQSVALEADAAPSRNGWLSSLLQRAMG